MTTDTKPDNTSTDERDRALAERLFGRGREDSINDSETKNSEQTPQKNEQKV